MHNSFIHIWGQSSVICRDELPEENRSIKAALFKGGRKKCRKHAFIFQHRNSIKILRNLLFFIFSIQWLFKFEALHYFLPLENSVMLCVGLSCKTLSHWGAVFTGSGLVVMVLATIRVLPSLGDKSVKMSSFHPPWWDHCRWDVEEYVSASVQQKHSPLAIFCRLWFLFQLCLSCTGHRWTRCTLSLLCLTLCLQLPSAFPFPPHHQAACLHKTDGNVSCAGRFRRGPLASCVSKNENEAEGSRQICGDFMWNVTHRDGLCPSSHRHSYTLPTTCLNAFFPLRYAN